MIRFPTFRSFFNLPRHPWQAGVALPKGVVSCSAGSTTFEQLGGASKPGAQTVELRVQHLLAAVSGFRHNHLNAYPGQDRGAPASWRAQTAPPS